MQLLIGVKTLAPKKTCAGGPAVGPTRYQSTSMTEQSDRGGFSNKLARPVPCADSAARPWVSPRLSASGLRQTL